MINKTSSEIFIELMRIARHRLLNKDFLNSLLTIVEMKSIEVMDAIVFVKEFGNVVVKNEDDKETLDKETLVRIVFPNGKKAYAYVQENMNLLYIPSRGGNESPFELYQKLTLEANVIENHTSTGNLIDTTVGRFILNYIPLASVFGDLIPYVNKMYKISDIEKDIANLLFTKKASITQYEQYINRGYFLGHMSDLFVPTMTLKSITTDPAIAIRKKELLEQYKDQLDDPNIISKIEDELLAMDKAYLKGDDALGYHEGIGKKSFDIHRKKLFLTVGGIESFDKDKGKYNFIGNSLTEGWDKKDFPVIANEIRKGSYSRGKETADGGAMTKFVLRVFQDLKITEEDCKTKRGLSALIDNHLAKELVGRHIVDKTGKTIDVITSENSSGYIGKDVIMRSPMYCETKNGLCYTCSGDKLKTLESGAIGVLAVDITSKFMLASMKLIHSNSISTKSIEYQNYFR